MIGRKAQPSIDEIEKPRGFDDYDQKLGDLLRGERATLGKSLLDVQRDLKIKATYINAIENCDLSAFEAQGFIAGYVRSYARYLGLDPDEIFSRFCDESGLQAAGQTAVIPPAPQGFSAIKPIGGVRAQAAPPVAKTAPAKPHPAPGQKTGVFQSLGAALAAPGLGSQGPANAVVKPATASNGTAGLFSRPNAMYAPPRRSWWLAVEPGALGSIVVLLLLIGGIGYGAWSVLQEVQRVQLAPVDQAPEVVATVDPLAGVTPVNPIVASNAAGADSDPITGAMGDGATSADNVAQAGNGLDRLYRPQALDVPVMTSRDGPIAAINPRDTGTLVRPDLAEVAQAAPDGVAQLDGTAPSLPNAVPGAAPGQVQVTAAPVELAVLAVRPSWVQITAKDGTVLFEKILDAGERYVVPDLPEAPLLRAGNSHAIYFAVNGRTYGPASPDAKVVKNLPLSVGNVTQTFAAADPSRDGDLAKFADLTVPAGPALPQTAAGPVAPLPPAANSAGN